MDTHNIKGTPETARLVPVAELLKYMKDPKFREVLADIDRDYIKEFGRPTILSLINTKQFIRDKFAIQHVIEQKRAIDIAAAKKAGKFNLTIDEAAKEKRIQNLNKNILPDPAIIKRKLKNMVTFDMGKN